MGLLRSLRSLRRDTLDPSSKTVIMTPMVHLLLLPLLFSIAGGKDLEEKRGPLVDTVLNVPEGTPVPHAIYQFQTTQPGVNNFRLSGEGMEDIKISKDGWLFLDKPLDWSRETHYAFSVEALANDEVVDGPVHVSIHVSDVNNNAPYFNQTEYTAVVREGRAAGDPFTRVLALDHDDPESPNARLSYSLVSQIPSKQHVFLFQINPETGEISTTVEGEKMLKAREAFMYGKGDDQSTDALKRKFDDYCPEQKFPYENNPFFTCVERAEMRRRNVDPVEDPDYTLFVRVQDLGGESEAALSGNARVHIVVQQNLWINPGPITVPENLETTYPFVIAKVQSNEPDAIYTLLQKERQLKFPFQITQNGEILLTEKLDREEKDSYILVVMAKDHNDQLVDTPMEIQVVVKDVNDNKPVCENVETVFELQENEPEGSPVGQLLAYDDDDIQTLNAQLTYKIVSQSPTTNSATFSIDSSSGKIQALRSLQRREHKSYHLDVRVSDADFSTDCKVVVRVIDVNNEMPLFEKSDYGSHSLAEDAPVGQTVATIRATDADEPDSGSSYIDFHISTGNEDGTFAVETDGSGVGQLVIAKPLNYESSKAYRLQIDARNPEPLMKGLKYGPESTAYVSVSVTDVDEAPEFSLRVLDVTVFENITKGSVLLNVEAMDPEGKEISFKLDGDSRDWLEIDAATGQIRTKDKLDRETAESFEVIVTAFEKANPEKSTDRVVSVRLLDVNDNHPTLTKTQAFICTNKNKAKFVILEAEDRDADPFSKPFTFMLGKGKKSPNWDLVPINATKARLILKKVPAEDKTFALPITITDKAGIGVPQPFEVRVCNCTILGHCYMEPDARSFKYGMGPTIGILAGTLGFCVIIFVVVIKRVNKGGTKKALNGEEERDTMM